MKNTYASHKKIALLFLMCFIAFITFSRAQVCTDNYEPNNNYVQATPVTPGNDIHALINPSGDVDVFSFPVTDVAHNIRIILSTLPANFDIALYNSTGVKIGVSKHRGKMNDTISIDNNPAGTYYARVYGNNGKFNASHCYTLSVLTGNGPFKLINVAQGDATAFDFSLFPNPATTQIDLVANKDLDADATVSFFDLTGRRIMSTSGITLNAGEQRTFDVSSLPEGTYLMQLESPSGLSVKKFVVSR
ncbi:MAG: T9SS type A sorting domain-containing protein [Chitinophagales bacterium]